MDKYCDKLIEKCEAELDALSKKADLDDNGLSRLDRWSHVLKSLETVKAMRDSQSYPASYGHPLRSPDYAGRIEWYPRTAYGDSAMRNAVRAPYGDSAAYGHADSLSDLHHAINAAKSEREREILRRAMREIEGM